MKWMTPIVDANVDKVDDEKRWQKLTEWMIWHWLASVAMMLDVKQKNGHTED